LTTGLEDGGRRAAIAFGVALAALAEGNDAHLFLSLRAAVFGCPSGCGEVQPPGFSDPLERYVQHFLELGGHLEVCSSCYEEYCRELPKDSDGRPSLRRNTSVESLGILATRCHQMPLVTF
jgi:predicted peroxiredoxin